MKLYVLLLIDFPVELARFNQAGEWLEVLVEPRVLVLDVAVNVSLKILVSQRAGDLLGIAINARLQSLGHRSTEFGFGGGVGYLREHRSPPGASNQKKNGDSSHGHLFYPAASCCVKSVLVRQLPRTALQHVPVMQQTIEHGAHRGCIT